VQLPNVTAPPGSDFCPLLAADYRDGTGLSEVAVHTAAAHTNSASDVVPCHPCCVQFEDSGPHRQIGSARTVAAGHDGYAEITLAPRHCACMYTEMPGDPSGTQPRLMQTPDIVVKVAARHLATTVCHTSPHGDRPHVDVKAVGDAFIRPTQSAEMRPFLTHY
jgi:hypothetical protein